MPSPDRRWIPPVLIVLATVASGIVGGRLPSDMTLHFGGLLPFSTDAPAETAPRWLVLGLMPALAVVLWLAFRLAPTAAGRRLGRRLFHYAPDQVTSPEQFARFGNTYEAIVLGVVALVLGLHAAVLAAALEAPALAARLVPAVFGGSLVLMGNVMPRLRPNWVAGLRTKRLLADPELWRATHRVFGTAFVVGGLLTIATAVVAPRFGVFVAIGAVAASCVVGFVASRRSGGRASVVAVGLLCLCAPALGAQDAPASVVEFSYSFTSIGFSIHGTLALPRGTAGRMPVVLIVAGSGPTDRNAPTAQPLVAPPNRNFMRSWGAYDPPADAATLHRIAPIVQGTLDLQTTMQDAELLHAAQPRATLVRLEGVNHVLKHVDTTDLQAQMPTYRDPSLPLAPAVVPAVARWIAGWGV